MMMPPPAITKQPEVNAAVAAVVRELSPAVQHIRYEIAPDWSGQSDDASNTMNLREIAPRVMWRMSEKLDLPNLGLFPYFDFRSQSEQAKLNEPAWA
jgi:hypothetical protein